MKKLMTLLFTALLVLALAACGNAMKTILVKIQVKLKEETKTIKIGATSAPHAEILEQAKPF